MVHNEKTSESEPPPNKKKSGKSQCWIAGCTNDTEKAGLCAEHFHPSSKNNDDSSEKCTSNNSKSSKSEPKINKKKSKTPNNMCLMK